MSGSLGNQSGVHKDTSALRHTFMMEGAARSMLYVLFFILVPWSLVNGTSIKVEFPKDVFHNKTIITDHHHLEEDLKHDLGEIDLEKASEDELEFYYFTIHDFDHNKLLDGLEILAALQESLEEHLGAVFSKEERMKHYIVMTDEVLEEDDLDKDGFLSFVEYMHSQKRTASPTTILDKTAKDKTGSKKNS
ncbi:multiple coagulation factor deficiency protein 2 homolog [Bufo bufo]|uniref:multiple coagulation factor deficiency protein 2 homolog n=1 Tax=Bufo bufo TaxID=8384 RepID=UPI001ABE7C70|nr:multiple coagulation factor deficiency protein 2 homolog [Bufo bufo]